MNDPGLIHRLQSVRDGLLTASPTVRQWCGEAAVELRALQDAEAAAAFYVRDDPAITPRRALERQAVEIEKLKRSVVVAAAAVTYELERRASE